MTGLLTDTFFSLKILRQYIKTVVDCKGFGTENTSDLMKAEKFYKVFVRGGIKMMDCGSTLYVKDMTEIFLKLVEF